MSPITEAFLSGVIVTATLTSGLIFLKFWRKTRDRFFLAFAASFLMEGINRVMVLFAANPSERSPAAYLVRAISFLIIIVAILRKNYRAKH